MATGIERSVIVTGDDLGLSATNNAGLLAAHKHGVLTTTCLMMGGDAVEEGIEIARTNPSLAVGLHIAFADTRPTLPPEEVPLLVGTDGRFPSDPDPDTLHKRALRSRQGVRQIKREIAAQFRAYSATGLDWDHVNTHRHIHRHPLLAWLLYREARNWPVKATRIPWDPPADILRHGRAEFLKWLGVVHGLQSPDQSIGRDWTVDGLLELLDNLPQGTTEIYFHPVTAENHMFAADLPVLLDPLVKAALARVTAIEGLRAACAPMPFRRHANALS